MSGASDAQRQDTFWVFDDIKSKNTLPALAIVEFQFVPFQGNADWDGFQAAITDLGYAVKRYESDGTMEISTRPIALSAEVIWHYEEQFTLVAEQFGFQPDGWGFFWCFGCSSGAES